MDKLQNIIDGLIRLSRHYGGDSDFVVAGGGNTSAKDEEILYVKASGFALASIRKDEFVAMDRAKLELLAEADLDVDPIRREEKFNKAIFDSKLDLHCELRPSVEVLIHHFLPGRYVVHTHATICNALACARDGKELLHKLFGDEVIWIPYVDPGFKLARTLRRAVGNREDVCAVLLENHGLVVTGDSEEAIYERTSAIVQKLQASLGENWQCTGFGEEAILENISEKLLHIAPIIRMACAEGEIKTGVVLFDDSPVVRSILGRSDWAEIAQAGPLYPDQIVYCGSYPLCLTLPEDSSDQTMAESIVAAVEEYITRHGKSPRVALVKDLGLFCIEKDAKAARIVRDVYVDVLKVTSGALRLGGVRQMSEVGRKFIENWEAEAYRKSMAEAGRVSGRASGKIVLVTGAAQGFGQEISEALASEGAHVVLMDMNIEGARDAAAKIEANVGVGRAIGVAVDVTSQASLHEAIIEVVRTYGGFDAFISNAGVLRAESVKTQSEKDFDFVTSVNYKGFFLCTQAASPILARQHLVNKKYLSDIIQINSKSGLSGSNRNGAYAGSKFGGIGLVQSFAMELIENGIKVNAICPGNFFDGPLWSDPEKGLFIQYLRTGKVLGALTVEDVKRAYEAKVPMGRGCRTADVMHAIFYLMDQPYETGQAVPVTGGQVMLH